MSKLKPGIGHVLAPWPFVLFGLIAVLVSVFAYPRFGFARGAMIAFDFASCVFLVMCVRLFRYGAEQMREAAQRNDANRGSMLLIAVVVTGVILVAVGSELSQKGRPRPLELMLVLFTLCSSWLFSTLVYTLHYAHLYYQQDARGNDIGGLAFPHTREPDYWDFAYYSSCLAMTFQTSDVDIESRIMRRVTMFHSLAAFVFNIGVIAFSINILGGS